MSKESGLGHGLWVDGREISNDIAQAQRIGGGCAVINQTGIDKSAFERRGGRRDGSIQASAFLNPDSGRSHPVLSTLPTGDRIVTYHTGTTLGRPAACIVGKQPNYDPTIAAAGDLTVAWATQGNGFALEWGELLTAGVRTDSAATDGAGVDFGAGASFGLQAYLHTFAFTGTDATVKLQHSDDDGSVDPYTDITGGGFAQVTSAPGSERIQTGRALAIKRWIRAVTVTTGGFSDLQFAVVTTGPNPVSVVF